MNLQVIPDGQLTQRFLLAREARAESGPLRSILEGAARRQLLRGLELPARGPVQSEALTSVRQRARAAPGHLHPSGQLRHRLRRAGEERARRQLHPESRATRRRGASAASGALHRAARQQIPGRVRSPREGADDPRRRDRRARRSWRPEAWARPSCCCAAAISTGRCAHSARRSARAGAPTRTSSRWPPTRTEIASGSRPGRPSPACWISPTAASGTSASSSRTTAFQTCCSARSRHTSTAGCGRRSASICSRSSKSTCVTTRRLRNLLLWLGAGKDAGDGQLQLKRRWFMPWKRVLDLLWEVEHSEGRAQRHGGDAPEPDRSHRRTSACASDLAPLQEPADAAPAGRLPDGRLTRDRRRRSPRPGASAIAT